MTLEQLYEQYLTCPKVITDSRQITPGALFFALKGERFNGNQFAEKALADGASFAIIDEPEYKKSDRYVLVDDALKTLQELARHHRRQFDIPLLAITGSNGKTTTKELISAILSAQYPTHFTKGNFNNHIGVPLTLLAMPPETKVAVIEMGANHVGEIDFLCQIAQPTHGLITNIGRAHLEGFGGIEGVKKAKSELYRYLEKHNGVAFVNLDEPFLDALSQGIKHRVFYQKSERPDPNLGPFETVLLASQPYIKVAFADEKQNLVEVQTRLIGAYNFNNIMTALAVGRYFKVPSQKIKHALENYVPKNNRSQVITHDTNTIILDAYNANPSSMEQALLNFSKMTTPKKVVIMGDMLELGNYSLQEHTHILEKAVSLNFDLVITVGEIFGSIPAASKVTHFKNTAAMRAWLRQHPFEHTAFLLKGSRGIGLERAFDLQ